MEDNKKMPRFYLTKNWKMQREVLPIILYKIGNHTHPIGVHRLKIKRHVLFISIIITQMLEC